MFNFELTGNCKAGIHVTTLEEIERNLVNNFPNSQTRRRNIDKLKQVLRSEFFVKYANNIDKIWIDGSFCSNKENPNDIDGIVFAKFDSIEQFDGLIDDMIREFGEYRESYRRNYCDLYFCVSKDTMDALNFQSYENLSPFVTQYVYWKGQFGFDRQENPKGIYSFDYEGGLNYG